jgi:hypothetical protein
VKRTTLLPLAAMLALTLLPASPTPARAEWLSNYRMTEAVGRVLGSSVALIQEYNYGFLDTDVCLVGAEVRNGESMALSFHALKGVKYLLEVAASDSTQQLIILVSDGEHQNIPTGNYDQLNHTRAVFVPKRDGDYHASIHVQSPESHGGFVAATVLRYPGGVQFSQADIEATFRSFYDMGGIADLAHPPTLPAASDYCHSFAGAVLGGSMQEFGFASTLDAAVGAVIGGASPQAKHIGVQVLDSEYEKHEPAALEGLATPAVRVERRGTVQMHFHADEVTAPAFVIYGLVKFGS